MKKNKNPKIYVDTPNVAMTTLLRDLWQHISICFSLNLHETSGISSNLALESSVTSLRVLLEDLSLYLAPGCEETCPVTGQWVFNSIGFINHSLVFCNLSILEECAKGICLCILLRSSQPVDRETVIEG